MASFKEVPVMGAAIFGAYNKDLLVGNPLTVWWMAAVCIMPLGHKPD